MPEQSNPLLKKNKFFHDGWSPIFITLRAQLICMINIRRGLCGYRHVLWDEDSRTHNITVLVARWKAIVDRFTFESEEAKEEIMSWTGTPPEFWLNSETQDRGALLVKLCEDIIHIKETIKGRKKRSSEDSSLTTQGYENETFSGERLERRSGR